MDEKKCKGKHEVALSTGGDVKSRGESNFFDKELNIRRLWIILFVICALTVIPDFITRRHPHFGIDAHFAFYAVVGFISCAALILLSKFLGLFLKVKEEYYDE